MPHPTKSSRRRAGLSSPTVSLAAAALAFADAAIAQTLTIESWRNDDADVWNNEIIPAFNKAHPGIKVQFKADPADRIQRGAQCAPVRRHGRAT